MRRLAVVLAILAVAAGSPSRASPPGRILFEQIADEQYSDVFTIRPDGTGLRRVTRAGYYEAWPAWAPDGKRLVADGLHGLVVRTATGRLVRRIAARGARDIHFSPDGSRIAFLTEECADPASHEDPACADLWVVGADRGRPRRLVNAGVDMTAIGRPYSWAPDGRRLVYRAWDNGLIVLDVTTGTKRLLGSTRKVGTDDPNWSPDGRWISFARQRGPYKPSDLFAIAPDGTGQHRLSRGIDPFRTAWSPDGTQIAYLVDAPNGDDWDVYVSLADGSHLRRIATAGDYATLIWSPDSSWLLWADGLDEFAVARADGRGRPIRIAGGDNPDWR